MLPFSIDLQPGEPLHEQILEAVREAMGSGQLRDGDLFPSARSMAQELRISPNAAAKVVAQLREEGLLAEQRGSTLMVRAVDVPKPMSPDELAGMVTVAAGTSGPAGFVGRYPYLDPAPAGKRDVAVLGTIGGYEVRRVIGQGGMGVVFEALDTGLMRKVAVKVLSPQLAASEEARARFLREARSAAAVDHENVLPIHSVGEVKGFPYLVMPLVDGESLQDRLDRDGELPEKEICRIAAMVASGLAAAHARGLIHRDIKPDNILIDSGGQRVWIADFGLARAAEDEGLTVTGAVAGTPRYSSPEQAEGKSVDFRTDLFSLGSVLFAMATGSPPFGGESAFAVLRKIIDGPTPEVREKRRDLSEGFAGLISCLLARDAGERPAGAEEVAERLRALFVNLTSSSPGDG